MRKYFVGALAVALTLAGATAAFGIGSADNTKVTVEINTSSAKEGTKRNPKPNSVRLTLLGSTKNGKGQPGTSKRLELTLPKGWSWNANRWPRSKRCDIDEVNQAKSDSVCPKGSKVGTGKSTATGGADEAQPSGEGNGVQEKIDVTAHVIKNGNLGFFLEGEPVDVNPPMIEGKLKGRTLSVIIPKTVQEPVPDVATGITKLNTNFTGRIKVRVKGKRRTYGITENSGGCSKKGNWVFIGRNVMRDGTVTDRDAVKCRQSGNKRRKRGGRRRGR